MSKKDAKIITRTDSERFSAASHVSDEKWKGWLLLVTVQWLKLRNGLKQLVNKLQNVMSSNIYTQRCALCLLARVRSPNLRWSRVTLSCSVTCLWFFFKGMWQCDTCDKHLPKFVMRIIYKSAVTQQAPDVYVTSGWHWTWRRTDVEFWLKIKIGLTSIFDVNLTWLNVGFWLHNLKTTKSQRQLTSVLDINLTLTWDVEFTLNFGHPTSQPKFNQISTSYDVVFLFCACWERRSTEDFLLVSAQRKASSTFINVVL